MFINWKQITAVSLVELAIIAAAQIKTSSIKSDNLSKITSFTQKAAERGASLVVFPELSSIYVRNVPNERLEMEAEPLEGEFTRILAEKARQLGICVVIGILEKSPMDLFNSAIMISKEGRLVSTYRKIHLFDAFGIRESDKWKPGDRIPESLTSHKLARLQQSYVMI